MAKFERFQHKGCLEELRVKSVIWSVDFNNYHPSCYGANVFSYLYENFAVICYFEGEGDNHKVKVLQRYEIPDVCSVFFELSFYYITKYIKYSKKM